MIDRKNFIAKLNRIERNVGHAFLRTRDAIRENRSDTALLVALEWDKNTIMDLFDEADKQVSQLVEDCIQ